MLSVIKTHRDGSATVSTRGFRRIVDQNGRAIQEFVAAANAKNCVETFNACFPNGEQRARAVTYKQAAAMEAANSKPAKRSQRKRSAK